MDSYSNELAGSVEDIAISDMVPPANSLRSCMNGIEQLAESIMKIGLLQPIVVRTNNLGSFELVAGNRRFNACKKLGWRKISCHLVELDDKSALEVSIIENIQRELLSVKDKHKQSQLAGMIRNKQLSSRDTRGLIKDDLTYADIDSLSHTYNDHYDCAQERISKSFDKSIIALRIAIKKVGSIVETIEDDWIFYDILLHHKNMLNSQIDLLIKEKRKYKNQRSLQKLKRLNL